MSSIELSVVFRSVHKCNSRVSLPPSGVHSLVPLFPLTGFPAACSLFSWVRQELSSYIHFTCSYSAVEYVSSFIENLLSGKGVHLNGATV